MAMPLATEKEYALRLDAADPLAAFRGRFYIPENMIYLDGNSLGLMSAEAEQGIAQIMKEWRGKGIGGWLEGAPPWFYLAEELGAMIAPLVGAIPESVVCTGSTTVNLHALAASFYKPVGRRCKILADELNFPSDIYALKGQIALRGLNVQDCLLLAPSGDGRFLDEARLEEAMTDEVALILLPSALYRSGQLLDMPRLTRKAHERGIVIGFDCSHSVGALPHYFDEWGVDFAFWCGYKYLNGGPGSPAFLYVNAAHFGGAPMLTGWFGCRKERQFNMELEFHPAKGAGAWQISTPCILAMGALRGALGIFREAGIAAVREKSRQLTEYFILLADLLLPEHVYGVRTGTPREPERRSGHVALEGGEHMAAVNHALKARGIVPDFRPPGIIRFAPVALYNTFYEVWKTVHTLKTILDNGEYKKYSAGRSVVA